MDNYGLSRCYVVPDVNLKIGRRSSLAQKCALWQLDKKIVTGRIRNIFLPFTVCIRSLFWYTARQGYFCCKLLHLIEINIVWDTIQ